jgi:mRNA interferase MazF
MVEKPYSPDRGDIAWINLDPTLGREQQKRRPALILTPKSYNLKTSLALIVPITSKVKGYSFEVALPSDLSIQGVILSDQIRSIDWRSRDARYIMTAPISLINSVRAKQKALLP